MLQAEDEVRGCTKARCKIIKDYAVPCLCVLSACANLTLHSPLLFNPLLCFFLSTGRFSKFEKTASSLHCCSKIIFQGIVFYVTAGHF